MTVVDVFCDGAITGNPGGTGGWGALLVWPWSRAPGLDAVLAIGGAELDTTNNRMEMRGAIEGLKAIRHGGAVAVRVTSDSQYVVYGMEKWIKNWIRNSALVTKPNADLWRELLAEEERHENRIEWAWVRGHSGHFWNERADAIAGQMVQRALIEGPNVAHRERFLRCRDNGAILAWPLPDEAREAAFARWT